MEMLMGGCMGICGLKTIW